jgi:peptidoglycan hydrolase-like protein with peptidoglycan-binding domain
MRFRIFLILLLVISFTGCATGNKNQEVPEAAQLNVRIGDLEGQLKQKDEEIKMLEEQAQKDSGIEEDKSGKAMKATPKRIQQALKNAKFYSGAADGKIGKRTRDAIKAFQRANGLKADGVVGGQTWVKLRRYLDGGN